MNINLTTLISTAAFEPDVKKKLIASIPSLKEDQKYELSMLAWRLIGSEYGLRLQREADLMLIDIDQGKRQYNKNDFVELEVKICQELAKKFEVEETQENISGIRNELKKYAATPFTQDPYQKEENTLKPQPERPQDLMKKVD